MSAPVPPSKPAIDIAKLRYILATDCGSTTTKAILVERVGDSWRQTQRAEAPTTVEEPFANVTIGVSNAITEIGELAGRRFIADDGTIIRRKGDADPDGCDLYISTSSAGGGLQMVVAGVVAGAGIVGAGASLTQRKPRCSSAVSGGAAMRALGR